MLAIRNLLKNVYGCIRNISKKSGRNCAVLVSGFSVFAMVSLHANGFGGAGRNKALVECSAMKSTEEIQAEGSGTAQQEGGTVQEGQEEREGSAQQEEQDEKEASVQQKEQPEKEVSVQQEKSAGAKKQKKGTSSKQQKDKEAEKQETAIASKRQKDGITKQQEGNRSEETGTEPEYPENTFAVSCRQAVHAEQSKLKEAEKAQIEKREVSTVCASVEPVQNEVQKPPANPYGSIAISEEDYDALLRIVQAEAGGEDEQGRILVAEVILNRVLAEEFASTVYDVIFEKSGGSSQFAPTADGRYYSVEVTQSTVEAVEKAIHEEDISQGALFFSARRKANPYDMAWFDNNLTWLFQYGGHEFYTLP